MGSYSNQNSGGGDSSDGEDESRVDAPLTDYEDEETDDEDDTAAGVAGAAAGAAAGAGAAGASGGAGTGAGAAVGTGAGVAGGGSSGGETGNEDSPEEGEEETAEEDDIENPGNDGEDVVEEDETIDDEPEEPENGEDESEEEPEQNEPPESGGTDERTYESHQPTGVVEDVGEQDVEDDPAEEDENEQEEKDAYLVIETDPWDNAGWELEPTISFLQRAFGDKLEVAYEPHPPRVFDANTMRTRWREASSKHRMPTDTDIWITDPPTNSVQSHQALNAAQEQGDEMFVAYLRRLRIAAQVEGTNIEDQDTLVALAKEAGLDRTQFETDYNRITPTEPEGCPETPNITGLIDDAPVSWTGFVEQGFAKGAFLGQGIQPEWQAVFETAESLVEAGTLLTTSEIAAAFPEDSEESIRTTLERSSSVEGTTVGSNRFWSMATDTA